MKDGWIQNDERRVLMDDRLLGHRAFSDLSFAQRRIFSQFSDLSFAQRRIFSKLSNLSFTAVTRRNEYFPVTMQN